MPRRRSDEKPLSEYKMIDWLKLVLLAGAVIGAFIWLLSLSSDLPKGREQRRFERAAPPGNQGSLWPPAPQRQAAVAALDVEC